MNSNFDFDSTTDTDGTLSSDSVTRDLQSDLLSATNYTSSTSGSITSLASLGVSTNQNGTLTVDTATLDNALQNNFSDVESFFQGNGTTTGFATTLNNTLITYTAAGQGAYTVELSSISSESQDLENEIDAFQDQMDAQETILTTEYNNANIALQDLPSKIKQTQILLGEDNSSSS